jgi:membrane protease YdiL (CAAX protease family)
MSRFKPFLAVHRWPAWGGVALFWGLFAVLMGLAAPVSAFFPGLWKGAALGTVVSAGAVLLSTGFLRASGGSAREAVLGFRHGSLRRFLLGLGCGLVLIAAHYGLLWGFGGEVTLERVPEVRPITVLVAIASFVPLAAMEELGFRGYPLQRLKGAYGLWTAQGVVAFAFAVYHVIGGFPWIPALLGTGMGSILFAMAAVATRGLAVPIGLHAAWNLGGWALGEKQGPGLWEIVVAESSRSTAELAGTLGYFGVLGVATFAFWLLHRRHARQKSSVR